MEPRIVSREEWLTERRLLLVREKALTDERDALSEARRRLPMVRLEKTYVFETAQGTRPLGDLFDGRSQLVVYHFMMGPDWAEGCPSCSLLADHFDGSLVHLAQRDVAFTAISRAPFASIDAFRRRMGWRFPWASSHGTDFNRDFHVSFSPDEVASGQLDYNFERARLPFAVEEMSGLSVFYQDASGDVLHSYSTYGRGLDHLIGVYNYLDFVPRGRDEAGLPWPMAWVRHHDKYATFPQGQSCRSEQPCSS